MVTVNDKFREKLIQRAYVDGQCIGDYVNLNFTPVMNWWPFIGLDEFQFTSRNGSFFISGISEQKIPFPRIPINTRLVTEMFIDD